MTIDKKFSKLFCLFIIGSVESHGVKDSQIEEKIFTHENLSIPFEEDIFQIMDKKASFEEKIQRIFQLHEKNISVARMIKIVRMCNKKINKILDANGLKRNKLLNPEDKKKIPNELMTPMSENDSREEKEERIKALLSYGLYITNISNIVKLNPEIVKKIVDKIGGEREKKYTINKKNLEKVPETLRKDMSENDLREEKEERIKALMPYELSIMDISDIVKLHRAIVTKIVDKMGGKRKKNITISKKNLKKVPEALKQDMCENDSREEKEERIKALLPYQLSMKDIGRIVKLHHTLITKIVDEMGGERKKIIIIHKKNLEKVPKDLKKDMSKNDSREEKEERIKALIPYKLSMTDISYIVKLDPGIVSKIVDQLGGQREKKYTVYKKNLENVPEALKQDMSENDPREEKKERIKVLISYGLSMIDIGHIVKLDLRIVKKIVDKLGGERKKKYTIYKRNLEKVPEALRKHMSENDSREEKKERIKTLIPYKLSMVDIGYIVKLNPKIVAKIVDEMGGQREKIITISEKNLEKVPEALRKDMFENDSREEKEERIKALLPYELSIVNISNIVKLHRKIVTKIVDKLGGQRKKINKRDTEIFNPKKLGIPLELLEQLNKNIDPEIKKERTIQLLMYSMPVHQIKKIVRLNNLYISKIADDCGIIRKHYKE